VAVVSGLPYYFVRRLPTGRWCVAHRVPRTGVDHVDAECLTLAAAQQLAAQMEQHRDCPPAALHVAGLDDLPALGLVEQLVAQMRELRATSTADKEALQAAVRKSAAVSDLARAITETGRVEVDHIRATNAGKSKFLAVEVERKELPNGIVGIRRHMIKDE
jgi:hypothetical protein